MTELHYLSATEALRAFRARTLSPVELMDAVIARAEKVEATVNALCHRFDERALEQARQAEARYMGNGEPPRPLEGIPLAVKEEEAVAGEPWTQGSLIYEHEVAEHSSPFAERILESGAIIHARTTAPEFSCAGFTHSRLWGVTRNPWNPEFAVGGSSGGSGAALAAGTATLASGSDIGGSIRIPASFNGVVGFKPPYGRVPAGRRRSTTTSTATSARWRARSPTARCSRTWSAAPTRATTCRCATRRAARALRRRSRACASRVSVDLGDWPVDPEVAANTLQTAAALRRPGAIVDEVDLASPARSCMRAVAIHFNLIFAAMVDAEVAAHGDLMCDYALDFASRSRTDAARDAAASSTRAASRGPRGLRAGRRAARAVRRARVPDDRHPRARRRRLTTSATGSRSAGSSSSTTSTRS